MSKGIIYYTDNRIQGSRIWNLAQKYIGEAGLPITSCSLRPIQFGDNIVLEGLNRSYPTMCMQILAALQNCKTDYVFFCEHDVLYHPSHFDYTPERDDVYYYNINNWRWLYPEDYLISYSALTSLSGMCCNRQIAVDHYSLRLRLIEEQNLSWDRAREPIWARRFGYEPGTKKRRKGGVTDEDYITRRSELPNIDIRHKWSFSRPKVFLSEFKHLPSDWFTATMDEIPGWKLKELI